MSSKSFDAVKAVPIRLTAGNLSLVYENGYVRSLIFNGQEIIRRIYMALRDEHWNTVPGVLSNVSLVNKDEAFILAFDSRHQTREIDFFWHGEIKGSGSGELSFSMKGTALSGFRRNRIGLGVLHPLSTCRGRLCTIEKVDGMVVQSTFPDAIAPFPFFQEVRGLSYHTSDGDEIAIRFEGDVFETEDQRNWTDASFKTYSTPVSLPHPVFVEKGMEIVQRVTFTPHQRSAPRSVGVPSQRAVPLNADFRSRPLLNTLPSIGVMDARDEGAGGRLVPALPHFSHRRFDIRFGSHGLDSTIARVGNACKESAIPAELALYFTGDFVAEASLLARALAKQPFPVARFLLYKSSSLSFAALAAGVQETLRRAAPGALLFGGTDGSFVEINREKPVMDHLDGVCFSAHPQSHTFDDAAIMENLPGLYEAASAARVIAHGQAVAISPLLLRPRKFPHLPDKDGGPDARMQTMFGAAWTFGAIVQCINANAASLTLEKPDDAAPVSVLLSWLAGCAGQKVVAQQWPQSGPAQILGLELSVKGKVSVIAANVTGETVHALFSGVPEDGEYLVLDAGSVGDMIAESGRSNRQELKKIKLTEGTIELRVPPYALVCFSER